MFKYFYQLKDINKSFYFNSFDYTKKKKKRSEQESQLILINNQKILSGTENSFFISFHLQLYISNIDKKKKFQFFFLVSFFTVKLEIDMQQTAHFLFSQLNMKIYENNSNKKVQMNNNR